MGTLVATIKVEDPSWFWWVLGAGVAMGILGILVAQSTLRPRQVKMGANILMIGIAFFVCGIIGAALVDSGREDRQASAIERELGYTDITFYRRGLLNGDIEFTASDEGTPIHGRILINGDIISVLVMK